MNTTATPPQPNFLATIGKHYGPALENANRAQLAELLSHCALEIYCRHHQSTYPSKALDALDFTHVSEDDLMTSAIAAAVRLRLFDSRLIGLIKDLNLQAHQEYGAPTYEQYPDY